MEAHLTQVDSGEFARAHAKQLHVPSHLQDWYVSAAAGLRRWLRPGAPFSIFVGAGATTRDRSMLAQERSVRTRRTGAASTPLPARGASTWSKLSHGALPISAAAAAGAAPSQANALRKPRGGWVATRLGRATRTGDPGHKSLMLTHCGVG